MAFLNETTARQVPGRRAGRRAPGIFGVIAIAVGMLTLVAPGVGAQVDDQPGGDQVCTGTVSASVAAASLPGGEWNAANGCLKADSFYQYSDGPVLAKAGIAEVTYTDGHKGRLAAGVLTLGNGIGLGIVGVEDAATGLVKWSAVLGDFVSNGDRVSVEGQGVALFPVENAQVAASFTGTGTDVAPMIEQGATTTLPAVTVPDATDPSVPDSAPHATIEPSTTTTAPSGVVVPPTFPGSEATVPGTAPSTTTTSVPAVTVEPNPAPSTTVP